MWPPTSLRRHRWRSPARASPSIPLQRSVPAKHRRLGFTYRPMPSDETPMNLEDKINAPIPTTVDPLESLANGDKRRKGDNAGTLAMPRKSKKSDAGKKGPKKALVFDGPADGSLGLGNLVNIRSDTAMARML